METVLKSRKKVKVEDVPAGQTFKLIQKQQAFLVIDLTKTDMFKEIEPKKDLVLRDDVVYCVDLETGTVEIFPRSTEVYFTPMKAEEIV